MAHAPPFQLFAKLTAPILWSALASLALGLGCGPTPPADNPKPPATATAAATASATASAPPEGLTEDDKKQLTKALDDAKPCMASGMLNPFCPQLETLNENPAVASGKADAFLVDVISGKDYPRQLLAGYLLADHGKEYGNDPDLATKVVEAAEAISAEADNPCGIGRAVGGIAASGMGLRDRIEKLLRSHPSIFMRQCIAHTALKGDSDAFVNVLIDILATAPAQDRALAVQGLSDAPNNAADQITQVCAALAKAVGAHADAAEAAEAAAVELVTPNFAECSKHSEAVLDAVEKWAEEGTIVDTAASVVHLVHKRGDAKQKARALAIAKKVVTTERNEAMARESALRFLFKADPKGKDLANKLARPGHGALGETAKELLGKSDPEKVTIHVFSNPAVERAVAKQLEKFRACYKKGLKKDPKLSGSTSLLYKRNKRGKATDIRWAKGDVPESVNKCASKILGTIKLPEHKDGDESGSVYIAFSLRSEEASD